MKKQIKTTFALGVLCLLYIPTSGAAEIDTNAAIMQALDKVTGRVNKITVPINSEIKYGDFSLVLRTCKKRPAEETPENFAFVDVTDKDLGGEEHNIFRGWIVSSAPGLNAIEHPIYDMWLLECVDADVSTVKMLTAEELALRDNLPTKARITEDTDKKITTAEAMDENSTSKVIHIKEFINEDRDIEKGMREIPAYISESSASYISDIDEGEEPENLLLFTKMQEINENKQVTPDEVEY